jgi:cyclic peptide transporter
MLDEATMNVFKVFQRQSKFLLVFIFIMGLINSLIYMGLLVFVNAAISGNVVTIVPRPYQAGAFFLLVLASLATSKFFQTHMVKLTHKLLMEFELSILDKLRFATCQAFDKIGAERVYTAIADTRVLGQVPEVFVNALNAALITICGLSYLFWISIPASLTVTLIMATLLLYYVYRNRSIATDLNTLRDLQNDYHVYLNDLLEGFREVKMSKERNQRMYDEFLKQNRLESEKLGIKTSLKYLTNELIGSHSWYLVLGAVIFGLPHIVNTNAGMISPFIATILYLMGPVATLILFIPFYTRVKISLQRIFQLEHDVNINTDNCVLDEELINAFENIRFEDVTFEYRDESNGRAFKVGPINLQINQGEVVFITGGNGSGKSTFISLLVGLYRPTSGIIYYNGEPVSAEKAFSYSNRFSAIFTNHYLFHRNYDGFKLDHENEELMQYLQMMEMEEVIKFDSKQNCIRTDLSKGQQKRLALIYGLMEHRSVMVLDEWAAEQDPYFRKYFYETLLGRFKQEMKTVIAVTHDDRYFHVADRIIRFDFGKITPDVK